MFQILSIEKEAYFGDDEDHISLEGVFIAMAIFGKCWTDGQTAVLHEMRYWYRTRTIIFRTMPLRMLMTVTEVIDIQNFRLKMIIISSTSMGNWCLGTTWNRFPFKQSHLPVPRNSRFNQSTHIGQLTKRSAITAHVRMPRLYREHITCIDPRDKNNRWHRCGMCS